ncbi:MAG TPA: hypothetical protein VIX86_04585 [Streptosporangiaceae bacterium]
MRRYDAAHREQARERMRQWRAANPDKKRAQRRRQYERLRKTVLDHFGWACSCCGTMDRLSIDHINGDGYQHRAQFGRAPEALYRWIIDHGFPPGFQTLCVRCNLSKARGEHCRLDHAAAV